MNSVSVAAPPKLLSIQILRALAAVMVVFHHFALEGGRYSVQYSWINAHGLGLLGESGVDLFFVISGFIMVYTTTRRAGQADALTFLRRRALRIYPLYWIWTTVLVVLWKLHLALKAHPYPSSYVLKSYLLWPAFNSVNLHPFLDQGWTLTFEFLFYILFTLVIAFGSRRGRAFQVTALLIGCFGLSFALPHGSPTRQIMANPLIFEFAYGMMAATICLRAYEAMSETRRHFYGRLCAVLGLVLFVCSTLVPVNDVDRFFVYGLPSFCLVLGAALWRERIYSPLLVFFGDASYSIYLVHGIGILLFSNLLKHTMALQRTPLDALILCGTLLLTPLSAVTYVLLERPLLRILK